MRLIATCLSIYIAFIVYGFAVMANEETPLASPLGQWKVDKVYRDNGFPTKECIMSTSFDNKIEISFKGKNARLTALRIKDVSGRVASNVKGFVGLGLGQHSHGLQSRSKSGQIDSSLLTVARVADKIIAENMFRLKIGGTDYYFSGVGFERAYDDMLECQGRKNLTTIKVVSDNGVLPMVRAPKENEVIMPAEPVDVVQAQPIDEIVEEEKIEEVVEEHLDPTPLMPMEPIVEKIEKEVEAVEATAQWTATTGQKVSKVLALWGAQEGINVEVRLDNNPSVAQDFAFDGSFEEAVNKLLNDNMDWVGTTPTAVLKDTDGTKTQIAGYKGDGRIYSATAVKSVEKDFKAYRWRALEGTNLRKVLQQWAVREGIEFVWDSDQQFFVRESVKNTDAFPEAVSLLLTQYEGQNYRPVAQLNTDPDTGAVSLIVKSLKSNS